MNPILLSSEGRPLRAVGGENAWKMYSAGDYTVSIETIEGEPACVIWPSYAPDAGCYAVCLSAYPHWLEHDGRPSREAYTLAARGLHAMGRDVTQAELVRLMTAVVDAYPWVARMPPHRDASAREPIYEATARVNGKVVDERAV